MDVLTRAEVVALADRLAELADELLDPLICRDPAYGVPGRAHCAACCYGTGLIITCDEEEQIANTAKAMTALATAFRTDPKEEPR